MSHLFNGVGYVRFSLNHHATLKKHMENRLEQATDAITDQLHGLEGQQQPLMDGVNFTLSYEGQQLTLPNKILQLDNLSDLLNPSTLEHFDSEEMAELLKLLPQQNRGDINQVFQKRSLNGYTPLQNFERQLKRGYFTQYRQRQDQINELLNQNRLKQIYIDLFNTIIQNRESQRKSNLKPFVYKDQESQIDSIQDLPDRGQNSDNSEATQTEEENNVDQFQEYPQQVYYRYDYTKLKVQEELISMGDDKVDRKANPLKNVITVKPRNSQWVQNFRKQEYQRYANPTKPWVYICEDGRKVTVAPVAKKISVLTGKPRYHAMLKNERPACVTILTLARDAAARLPNGVGTRADICQLVKQSQYITEDLPEEKLSSTISGALDRLHYMSDACVKYDSEKKLWIYLHIDRSHEHPGWGDDGDQYTEKNSVKKKKTGF